MPVSRKRGRSKPSRWARSGRRKKWETVGSKILRSKIRANVRRILNKRTELKFIDSGNNLKQIYHNGGSGGGFDKYCALPNLCATAGGVTDSTRLGDKVNAVGALVKLYFQGDTAWPNAEFRVIVYHGRPEQITDASCSDLFMQTNGSYTNNRMLLPVNKEKYQVVRDIHLRAKNGDYSLEETGVTGAVRRNGKHYLTMWIPMRNKVIQYNNSGPYPMQQSMMYNVAILGFCNQGASGSDTPGTYDYQVRFYFRDA